MAYDLLTEAGDRLLLEDLHHLLLEPLGALIYTYAISGVHSVEARVKITDSLSLPNRGAALTLADGTYRYVAWLRMDGVNIDGEANIPMDLASAYHYVRLEAIAGQCRLYIDGLRRQDGFYMNEAAIEEVTFGSVAPAP